MSDSLFVYGTLQLPQVLQAVTGRGFPAQPAVLEGYERSLLRGRTYPGIREVEGGSTPGLLYFTVGERVFELLDRFEGRLYERRVVVVRTTDGATHEAHAYVVPESRIHLLTARSWEQARFVEAHLAAFLVRCERFRRRQRD